MAVTSTDLLVIERDGTLYKAPVSDLPLGIRYVGPMIPYTTGWVENDLWLDTSTESEE